jgi:uncharacterized membrane protein YfcA
MLLDPISMILVLIGIGVGAGALGSVLGVGGGIIMVPALTFLGLPPAHVASTSLFAVTSTSVSSTFEYSRQKRIDYKLGIQLSALAIPGAIVGAFVSDYLTEGSFKLAFGILLVLTGLYILYRNSILKEGSEASRKQPAHVMIAVFAATFGAGLISSVFGVGGGIIFVPIMLLVMKMTMQRAAPTSQLTLMITSIAGVLTHSFLGHPDYIQALALSAGAFAGAQVGARLSKSAKDVLLQRLLGIALIGVAVKFILDWFSSR